MSAIPVHTAPSSGLSAGRGPAVEAGGALRAASHTAVRCPLTIVVVVTLLSATAYLDASPAAASAGTEWASTNVHNLAHHPLAALLTSMFVVVGRPWLDIALVAVACGVVERRLGASRAILIALSGQIVASLITEYGAAAASALHLIAPSSPTRPDVGVSYAMCSLLAAAALLLPRRWRAPTLAALAGTILIVLATEPSMTTAGHALSLACGAAALAVLARRRRHVTGSRSAGTAERRPNAPG